MSYPRVLIRAEMLLANVDHPRARAVMHWLAARRLNSALPGLLQALFMQAYNGSLRVTISAQVETAKEHEVRRLSAEVEHAKGVLATIQLFVYNELKQRGLLHLVDGFQHAEPIGRAPGRVVELGSMSPWTKEREGDGYRPLRVLIVPPGSWDTREYQDADYVLHGMKVVKDRYGRIAGPVSPDELLATLRRDHDEIEVRRVERPTGIGRKL